MDISQYDVIDPTFVEDLKKSRIAVDVVAKWLSEKGYPVIVRPTFIRPDPSQMHQYSDNGDLEIIQRVEVKRRSFDFTCKQDFLYNTVIVDSVHAYDRANPKPYAYVILNNDMTYAFVVECKTYPRWERITHMEKARNRERTVYLCPLDCVRVEKI